MKIACLIDLDNKTIKLEGEPIAKRLIIDFTLVGKEGEEFDLSNLGFGYQIQPRGGNVLEESWPIPGIRFATMHPGIITSPEIELKADTDYKLLVWYAEQLYRATDLKIFNSGKPEKLFDSMIWNEKTEEWEFLKPCPDGREDIYDWNEEKLEWELFASEN